MTGHSVEVMSHKLCSFELGPNLSVHGTCSVLWKGEIYFFGGFYYSDESPDKYILKLIDNTLQLLGTLETYFVYGACG